jgi:hypothetical protein
MFQWTLFLLFYDFFYQIFEFYKKEYFFALSDASRGHRSLEVFLIKLWKYFFRPSSSLARDKTANLKIVCADLCCNWEIRDIEWLTDTSENSSPKQRKELLREELLGENLSGNFHMAIWPKCGVGWIVGFPIVYTAKLLFAFAFSVDTWNVPSSYQRVVLWFFHEKSD